MENISTDQLESMVRGSLGQEGYEAPPPIEELTKSETKPEAQAESKPEAETPASKQQAENQDAPTDESVTDEEPKAEEKEEEQPKEKKDEAKPESEFLKKVKEEKRKEKTWTQINERKEHVETREIALQQREQAFAQREAEYQQKLAQAAKSNGKLPDYKAPDGNSYPADAVRGLVRQAFAAGEDQQGEQALEALLGLARQDGVNQSLSPTAEQFAQTKQKIELEIARRPELAPTSGSKQAEVLGIFFKDPDFANFIARRQNGVRDVIDMADAIAKGLTLGDENKALKAENAQLKKQVGDKSKEVAHYEKATAPARGGVPRKPAPAKPIEALSTADLEAKTRQAFAEIGRY